jgi:hypothetical protein
MVFLNNPMSNILFQWLSFQFFDGPRAILKAWGNFLLFTFNYFSITVLLKTLFAYWHKYSWQSPKGFYPGKWLEAKLSNLISRILGAFVRLFLIVLGIIAEVFVFGAGILVLCFWLVLPFILAAGIIFGLKLIF